MRRGAYPLLRDTEEAQRRKEARERAALTILFVIGALVVMALIGPNCSHGRC